MAKKNKNRELQFQEWNDIFKDQELWNSTHILFGGHCSGSWKIPKHTRHYHELWLVTKGYIDVTLGSFKFIAKSGNLVYNDCWKGEHVKISKNGSILFLTFQYRSPKTNQLLPRTCPIVRKIMRIPVVLRNVNTPLLFNLFSRTADEIYIKRIGWHQMALSYLRQIMIVVARTVRNEIEPLSRKTLSKAQQIFESAVEYMEEHVQQHITVGELANYVNSSPRHFARLFKTVSGVSPMEYVVKLKIEQAKRLLMNQNILIKQVASLCGFSDPHYFSRFFKKVTGFSASDFLC